MKLKTGAKPAMEKGTVVYAPCKFKRGGFPNERVFVVRSSSNTDFSGVADVSYCYRQDGNPLGDKPVEGQTIEGLLIGVVVKDCGNDVVRVHLPDGEVYDLSSSKLAPVRRANPKHVSV